jgi:hypothetical protein
VKRFFQGSQKLCLTLLTGIRPKAESQLKRKCPGPSRPVLLGERARARHCHSGSWNGLRVSPSPFGNPTLPPRSVGTSRPTSLVCGAPAIPTVGRVFLANHDQRHSQIDSRLRCSSIRPNTFTDSAMTCTRRDTAELTPFNEGRPRPGATSSLVYDGRPRTRSEMVYAAADARAVEKGIIVVEAVRIIQICVIRTVVIAVVGADVRDT